MPANHKWLTWVEIIWSLSGIPQGNHSWAKTVYYVLLPPLHLAHNTYSWYMQVEVENYSLRKLFLENWFGIRNLGWSVGLFSVILPLLALFYRVLEETWAGLLGCLVLPGQCYTACNTCSYTGMLIACWFIELNTDESRTFSMYVVV